jgi:acetyl-CoA C-acetyltransferase
MKNRVAIVGAGYSKFESATPSLSYKEMMFEAATRAYEDAKIDPRKDVRSFICCTEDFWEGNSIADEYMPDQIGAVLRPLCTITADGLIGLGHAFMHILSGISDIVVLEAHSKASDIVSKRAIEKMALDPTYSRALGVDATFLAGLEMNRFAKDMKLSRDDFSLVVSKNKINALKNPNSVYAAKIDFEEVSKASFLSEPLKELDVSQPADGAVVLVLASADRAKKLTKEPIWVNGVGWSSYTSWVEDWDFSNASYATSAAKTAYKMGGIANPTTSFDFAEIDDTYSYKELQHLIALSLTKPSKIVQELRRGKFHTDGLLPINPSGGSLGMGNFLEAMGAIRLLEAYQQLKGIAGQRQLPNVSRALVQSWRGLPTATGAVAVLSN